MRGLRLFIVGIVAGTALAAGALFALPLATNDFAAVKINGAALLVEVAADDATRTKGLSGRGRISESGGMLFLFDAPDQYGIWMKDMAFPIDVFWIRDGAVVDLEEGVLPPTVSPASLAVYYPDVPATMALETKAGFAKKHGVTIGDRVVISLKGKTGAVHAGMSADASVQMPSPAPHSSSRYTIEALRTADLRGRNFTIGRTLGSVERYEKRVITYESRDLTISGVMNVPWGAVPQGGFPVLILNHGLIAPEVYFSGRGSKREQDFFTRHGYVTIHPDYRGHASSSPQANSHHDFYVGYTEDVVALIDALKALRSPVMNLDRLGMWGHSMGGGIAARVAVLRPEVRAYVLFAPISADVEDNFYELTVEEVAWLNATYGSEGSEVYRALSPIAYFRDVTAPMQLHHGAADKDVPLEFSKKMFEALRLYGKKAEFFIYPGEGHEFGAGWQLAAERALQFFDHHLKR